MFSSDPARIDARETYPFQGTIHMGAQMTILYTYNYIATVGLGNLPDREHNFTRRGLPVSRSITSHDQDF